MNTDIKAGRHVFTINQKDSVYFNGVSYSLQTRSIVTNTYGSGTPTLSRIKCEKWIKQGVLVERQTSTFGKIYKFDLEKLSQSKIR